VTQRPDYSLQVRLQLPPGHLLSRLHIYLQIDEILSLHWADHRSLASDGIGIQLCQLQELSRDHRLVLTALVDRIMFQIQALKLRQ
jgi:hypothetical protein